MNIQKDKEFRGYIGAGIIFFLVIGLLLFLSFYEVPQSNNDIFKVIVGMLVGSLSLVIATFVGKDPEEVSKMKAKNESLEKQVAQIIDEKDKIGNSHAQLVFLLDNSCLSNPDKATSPPVI